jgi:hypothetical protein
MTDCVHGNYTELAAVATARDCLGWDSMLEGWISTHWLILVAPFLLKLGGISSLRHGVPSLLPGSSI